MKLTYDKLPSGVHASLEKRKGDKPGSYAIVDSGDSRYYFRKTVHGWVHQGTSEDPEGDAQDLTPEQVSERDKELAEKMAQAYTEAKEAKPSEDSIDGFFNEMGGKKRPKTPGVAGCGACAGNLKAASENQGYIRPCRRCQHVASWNYEPYTGVSLEPCHNCGDRPTGDLSGDYIPWPPKAQTGGVINGEPCKVCNGTGDDPYALELPCTVCGGTGYRPGTGYKRQRVDDVVKEFVADFQDAQRINTETTSSYFRRCVCGHETRAYVDEKLPDACPNCGVAF